MRKLLLLSLVLLSFSLFAQPQGIWGERGISRRFVLRGDLLYSADGRGVSVYDVSNPASIRRIDVESGDAESRDLAFVGATDLVLATSAGIDRFSVNADGTLNRLASTEVPGGVTRVAGTPTRAIAAAGRNLLLLSRTNDALAVEFTHTFTNSVRALAVSGNTAYAAVERTAIYAINANTGETLNTIAVDATGLAISGPTLWASADIRGLFSINPVSGTINGVTGAGEYKFADVAASGPRVYAIEAPNRVHVFDGLTLAGTLTDWANVLAASGSRIFLAGATVDDEKMTFETGVPVRAYDTANAAAPVKLGDFTDYAGPVSGVWTDGSIAYVVDAPYLRVLDISKTTEPRLLTSILVPNIQDHVRVKDNRLINYGRVWVNLIDVAKPRQPKFLGAWHTQGHAPSYAALARDTIVEANDHSGLHVVDYTDPGDMHQISGRIFHYHDIAAGDDAIYTIQSATFLTIDLQDRRRVVDRTVHSAQYLQMDTVPANAAAPTHVALRTTQGVALYTLQHDRFDPRLVRFVPLGSPGLLATSATAVFVNQNGFLQRLEVANPSGFTPTEMAVTSPMQMSVAGEKVVIADRYRLRVYGPDTAPPPAQPGRRRAVSHR
ncbi:MAG TPA: hypothetical protein VEU30_12180 [Thermoanaerobaculia bacterium]|nr:hypothetical protein [Thermoanaerobaculia bacterium]